MKRGFIALLAVCALLIPGVGHAAPVTAGKACTKAGAKSGRFVCMKAGKKLVWKLQPTTKPTPATKPTQAPTPAPSPTLPFDPTLPREMDDCKPPVNTWVIGYSGSNRLVYLSCGPDGKRHPQNGAPPIDQSTGRPIKGPLGSMVSSTEYLTPPRITTAPRTAITNASQLAAVEQCKILDAGTQNAIPNNPQRHFVSGFPMYPDRAKLTDTPVVQFVAVDFSDLPGMRSPRIDHKQTVDFLKSYWEGMSTNPITLEIRVPDTYTRLPKTVMDYDLAADFFKTGRPPTGTWNYLRAALAATDAAIDFSDVDVVAIVPPAEVTRQQIGGFTAQSSEPGGGFRTNEKTIMNALISAGPISSEAGELLNWAHELGHNFGLTDIRNTLDVANQDSSDLGVFDLMNSMVVPELLAWQRFILGILNDDQVRCVTTAAPTTHWLRPVEQKTTDTKLLVIPTGTYTAIAVESRRAYGYDVNLGTRNEGPIVYTIDTTIPYRYSTMKIVPSPSATDSKWRRDAALLPGEAVTVQGWTITHLETGAFGDVVRAERTS